MGHKCKQHWRHDQTGWEVLHCGHPTAIWPYFAIDPAAPGDTTVSHNGKGFASLEKALDAVDAVIAGRLIATTNRCTPGTRRICSAGESHA
jgi:hypothetical protein